jgi:L-ascorbate metabolism protein UlaG (beta-lactamase superfamily)
MLKPRLDRRRFLRTATAGTAVAAIVGTSAATPVVAARGGGGRGPGTGAGAGTTAATLRWLGTSGWRVEIGSRTLLVDPYLSRFNTGLFEGAFDPATELTVDAAAIAEHAGDAETVLVTHSHWDHFNDVPHIAGTTGAWVVGTLTTYQVALAYGVAASALSPVRGGEVFDFGSYVVEVVASLHSRNASYSMAFPGVRLSRPPRPQTIADLPEGDTLAFQLTVRGGPSVFFMGASDFVERNLRGLAPDVAMIALPSSDATHAYVPRLLDALDRPATVVPVHWDNFEVPLQNPPRTDQATEERLRSFVRDVRRAAPGTEVIVPEYLTPIVVGGPAG